MPWTTFQPHAHWARVAWLPFSTPPPIAPLDIVVNVVLYVPFGFFYARSRSRLTRVSLWGALWAAALSACTESTQVFSRGNIAFLLPTNHRVLAYVRAYERDQVLIVNNLSGTVQAVELDLRQLAGLIPIEMFGNSLFPRIGEVPYMLTLGPYDFYWFKLRRL